MIGLLSSVSWATDALEQGQPAPYPGIILNDDASVKALYDLQKLPILQEQ